MKFKTQTTLDLLEEVLLLQQLLDSEYLSPNFWGQFKLLATSVVNKYGFKIGDCTSFGCVENIMPEYIMDDNTFIAWTGITLRTASGVDVVLPFRYFEKLENV